MRISINGKNIEVSDYLSDLVTKKVSKLDKYFPEDTEAHVTLSVEKNRHIVEITIPYSGGIIRGEEVSGDMYASIDTVIAKVEKQIMRHRTKLEKNLRAEAFAAMKRAMRLTTRKKRNIRSSAVKALCHKAHGRGRGGAADGAAGSFLSMYSRMRRTAR